jgi:hypothetical protein
MQLTAIAFSTRSIACQFYVPFMPKDRAPKLKNQREEQCLFEALNDPSSQAADRPTRRLNPRRQRSRPPRKRLRRNRQIWRLQPQDSREQS